MEVEVGNLGEELVRVGDGALVGRRNRTTQTSVMDTAEDRNMPMDTSIRLTVMTPVMAMLNL